ncbi:MAG: hypothetical protein GY861_11060, partial [bacterium]|nr:hypothetical protein [bacterium]
QELRNAASKVSFFHIKKTTELEGAAGLIEHEEGEHISIRGPESPPPSSESKTSTDEKAEEKRRNVEKEKAHQRRFEQGKREEQWKRQQEISYTEQASLAHQRDQDRFYTDRGMTKEQYNQLSQGHFIPATSRR